MYILFAQNDIARTVRELIENLRSYKTYMTVGHQCISGIVLSSFRGVIFPKTISLKIVYFLTFAQNAL